MKKVQNIVDELLKKYVGGEVYFDNLDAELRKPENIDIIHKLFENVTGNIVVTGNFGAYIADLFNAGMLNKAGINLYHFNGGLRTGDISNLQVYFWAPSLTDITATFIDDSFYSGTTFTKINQRLEENYDILINQIRVVYNGSKKPLDNIKALYTYYKN